MELPTIPSPPADYGFLVALLCSLLAFGLVLSVIAGRWVFKTATKVIETMQQRIDNERADHKSAWAASEAAKTKRGEELAKRIDDGNRELGDKINESIKPLEDRIATLEKQSIGLDYRLGGLEADNGGKH